jgi:ribosomal protein L37AE/L43A
MQKMTSSEFFEMFSEGHYHIGHDMTEEENTNFYAKRTPGLEGDSWLVGEARTDRRATITHYRLLEGHTAEMVVYWYTVKPREDDRKECYLLLRTMIEYGARAIELGCECDLLKEICANLEKCLQEMKLHDMLGKSAPEVWGEKSAPIISALGSVGGKKPETSAPRKGVIPMSSSDITCCPNCCAPSYERFAFGEMNLMTCDGCGYTWEELAHPAEPGISAPQKSAHPLADTREGKKSAHAPNTPTPQPLPGDDSMTLAQREALARFIRSGRSHPPR